MRYFKCFASVLVLAAIVALAFTAKAAEEKEKKISKSDIPHNVMASVEKRLPGVQVTSAEKEMEDGNVVYDLELKLKDRKYEMDVKEDGTILEIEKQIKNPPAALSQSIKAKYPDAKIDEVMEVNKVKGEKETPQNYEVTITTGGKHKEVIVSLDGKRIKGEEGAD